MSNNIPTLKEVIKIQIDERHNILPNLGLKINLYRNYEVFALSEAIKKIIIEGISKKPPIESIMVGDSYFTTHLAKKTTQLCTKKEQKQGLDIMISLIKEVRIAINSYFLDVNKPYLIGDMPDGSNKSFGVALQSARYMIMAGADIVKIEITSNKSLDIVKRLCERGFHIMAHIGYTPQNGILKRYGNSVSEALSIFSLVRKLKEYGVVGIVLEMVDEIINRCLCKNSKNIPQIYSIFSGKAKYGGQSLNIWDSVFKPDFSSKYFPPTADYDRSDYPEKYTHEVIKNKIYNLILLTLEGKYPKTPISSITDDQKMVLSKIDPWEDKFRFISL